MVRDPLDALAFTAPARARHVTPPPARGPASASWWPQGAHSSGKEAPGDTGILPSFQSYFPHIFPPSFSIPPASFYACIHISVILLFLSLLSSAFNSSFRFLQFSILCCNPFPSVSVFPLSLFSSFLTFFPPPFRRIVSLLRSSSPLRPLLSSLLLFTRLSSEERNLGEE